MSIPICQSIPLPLSPLSVHTLHFPLYFSTQGKESVSVLVLPGEAPGSHKARWSPTALTATGSFLPSTSSSRLCGDACFVSHGPERVPLYRPSFVTMTTSDGTVLSSPFESRTPGANRHIFSKLFPFDHCHPAQSLSPQFCDTPEPLVFQTTHCPHGFFWFFFLGGRGFVVSFRFVFCFTNYSSQSFPFSINTFPKC